MSRVEEHNIQTLNTPATTAGRLYPRPGSTRPACGTAIFTGIMPWVTKLAQMDLAFENLVKERDRETANKTHIAVKAARRSLDEAYRYIVKSINAMLHLEILTDCEEFVNTMNAVIHRYKTMINQQHGHHHGGGTTPPSGGGGEVIHPVGGDSEEEEE